MNRELETIKKMHQTQGKEKIQAIQQKIDTTKYNIEVSKDIIAETPSDAQAEQLREKNTNRHHAIAGLQKEIRDIEQVLEQEETAAEHHPFCLTEQNISCRTVQGAR